MVTDYIAIFLNFHEVLYANFIVFFAKFFTGQFAVFLIFLRTYG
jgi:hypothetical protein